jgi:hypothetical protein
MFSSFLLFLSLIGISLSSPIEPQPVSPAAKATSEFLSNLQHPSEANGGILECLEAVCLLHDSAVDLIGDLGHWEEIEKDAQEALRQVKDIQAFCDPYPPGAFEEAVDNLMPGSKDGLMETYWRVSSLGGDQCTQKAIDLIPAIQSLLSAFQSQDYEAFLSEFDASAEKISEFVLACVGEENSGFLDTAKNELKSILNEKSSQCKLLSKTC